MEELYKILLTWKLNVKETAWTASGMRDVLPEELVDHIVDNLCEDPRRASAFYIRAKGITHNQSLKVFRVLIKAHPENHHQIISELVIRRIRWQRQGKSWKEKDDYNGRLEIGPSPTQPEN